MSGMASALMGSGYAFLADATFDSASAVSTGDVTEPTSTVEGQAQLLLFETSGEYAGSIAVTDFTVLEDLAEPADATGSRFVSYYRIRGAGAPGTITMPAGTNHRVSAVLNFNNVSSSAPINATDPANGAAPFDDPTSSASVSQGAIYVIYGSRSNDSAAAIITAIASTTTTNAAVRVDGGTAGGHGGGIFAVTGEMPIAGTATISLTTNSVTNGIKAGVAFAKGTNRR